MSKLKEIEHSFEGKDNVIAFSEHAEASFTFNTIEGPAIARVVSDLLSHGFSGNVLDAACGSGRVARFVRNLGIPGRNIIGVDASVDMIEEAKRLENPDNPDRIHFWAADITHAGQMDFVLSDRKFGSRSYKDYGLIVTNMSFEFLDNRGVRRALQNFYSHMRDGGTLYYVTTNPSAHLSAHPLAHNPLLENRRDFPIAAYMPWGKVIPNYYGPAEFFEEETSNAGFKDVQMKELPVPLAAYAADPQLYLKYSKHGAPRLGVLAHKK